MERRKKPQNKLINKANEVTHAKQLVLILYMALHNRNKCQMLDVVNNRQLLPYNVTT